LLFQKIEDLQIQQQIDKLLQTRQDNLNNNQTSTPAKPEITFEEFSKMDIRVSTIIKAEKVPKTKKLLKLQVDTGLDNRTIVSGIAEFFSPEEVIGKKVLVLINLDPKEIKGIKSHGMILMGENPEGVLGFLQADDILKNGAKVS
jgi:methionyl-tRNA synthetase